MLAVIDNYDSFTYNLVQYFFELGVEVRVFRNNQVNVEDLRRLGPALLVISPGPGNPDEAGVSGQAIKELGPEIPTLGVCLGHQCIGAVFGARVGCAERLMHGKSSLVYHDKDALFAGMPNPFEAGRYHSLIVEEPLPPELQRIASTKQGELMALRHRDYPIYGVQFHPESVLTPHGKQILINFLGL